MKTKRTKVWEASDGAHFTTVEECKKHEQLLYSTRLVGRTEGDISRALKREDPDLADALEQVGNMIADKRRQDGELKRRPRDKMKASRVVGEEMERITKNMKAIS